MEPHGTDLVATIAIALGAAFVAAYLARLIGLPAIVGYLLAGVAVGPFTPGLVADPGSALQLAEVGVALLMFGVGLHFSLRDLARVYRVAVPGAIGQIAAATGLGTLAGLAFGWELRSAVVLRLAISVGSTVVLVRALQHRRLVDTDAGRVAIGCGIRGFGDDYSGAERHVMSECLRCGAPIVDLANWLIEQEDGREPKTLVSITPWDAKVVLARFQNQQVEAAAIARAIAGLVDAGVAAHEILVLAKSDHHGRISSALMERCEELGVQVYRPRNTRLQGDDLQRVVEYLALASSLQEGGIDHLALRALLELEDNDIGSRRLMTVVRLAMERGLRFGHALEYLRLHPELERRSRLGAVVEAGDEILERARRLSPDEDETLAEWLTRVAGHLGVDDATFRTLFALVGGTEDELEDEPIFDEPEHVPEPQGAAASHLEVLRDAMGGLAEAVPPQLPGSVTFTTMHGAKGLTADVVFVLQVEDEVIPGIDAEGTLDEMRRLLYVSLTRACQRRTGNQRYVGDVECEPRTVSRFIRDYRLEGISGEELVKSMPDIIGGLWD